MTSDGTYWRDRDMPEPSLDPPYEPEERETRWCDDCIFFDDEAGYNRCSLGGAILNMEAATDCGAFEEKEYWRCNNATDD